MEFENENSKKKKTNINGVYTIVIRNDYVYTYSIFVKISKQRDWKIISRKVRDRIGKFEIKREIQWELV